MKTITIEGIRSSASTYSVKDDSPRGIKTVAAAAVKVGDIVVINNAFVLVVDAPAPAQPEAEQEAEEKTADAPEWIERDPYDYRAAIIADIKTAINSGEYDLTEYDSREEAEEALNDKMWIDDSITGNASGSYTFSRYRAEEYLCHNAALLFEALDEFGGEIPHEAEVADVTIRCYLLGECIAAALDDIGYSWGD